MAKGKRNRKNRKERKNLVNKTVERYDGYTITRWIDHNAGNTVEERKAYFDRTYGVLCANREICGIGFILCDDSDGEVLDFTFDDEETCREFKDKQEYLRVFLEKQLIKYWDWKLGPIA